MKELTKEEDYKINMRALKRLLETYIGSLLIGLFGLVEIILFSNGGN